MTAQKCKSLSSGFSDVTVIRRTNKARKVANEQARILCEDWMEQWVEPSVPAGYFYKVGKSR